MKITKKQISMIYQKFENDPIKQYEKFKNYLQKHTNTDFINTDWKNSDELIKKFMKFLKKEKYSVIEDPIYERSEHYGFVIVKDNDIELRKSSLFMSTSYVGTLHIKYKDLVKVFGNPHNMVFGDSNNSTTIPSGDDKVSCQWSFLYGINDEKDIPIRIYDYKIGIPYLGSEKGKRKEDIDIWNIGSNNKKSLEILDFVLTLKLSSKKFKLTQLR